MDFKTCPNCKGQGSTEHSFEAEEATLPCKACNATGKVDSSEFFQQEYDTKNWLNEISTTYYQGPCLDYTLFDNLRIIIK